ncbi:MAG: hypothetical protein Q8Q09_07040 [Deltaproteobacteria bacterium]|nr:hypothetical protein [Deltaproteobacteria bacterium]
MLSRKITVPIALCVAAAHWALFTQPSLFRTQNHAAHTRRIVSVATGPLLFRS